MWQDGKWCVWENGTWSIVVLFFQILIGLNFEDKVRENVLDICIKMH